MFIVATLLQFPFAVVEIQLPLGVTLRHHVWQQLFENSWLAAVIVTNIHSFDYGTCTKGAHRAFVLRPDVWLPQTTEKRTLVTIVAPVSVVFAHHEFVNLVSSLLALHNKRRSSSPAVALEFSIAGSETAVLAVLTKDLKLLCGTERQEPQSCIKSVSEDELSLLGSLESERHSHAVAEALRFFCRHEMWKAVSPEAMCSKLQP